MRDYLDVPLPPKPPPTAMASSLADAKVDFTTNPIKGLLAMAKGTNLERTPVATGGDAAPCTVKRCVFFTCLSRCT